MVKGVEKLDIKSNLEIISLKMCFNLFKAQFYGTQILRECFPQSWPRYYTTE